MPEVGVLEYGKPSHPTVVLLHGLGMGNWMWRPQGVMFAEDYHVMIPRLLGPGGTVNGEPFTLQRVAAQVIELIQLRGMGKAHLCGLSLGAMVALQVYQQAPSCVSSLVLSGGQVHPNPVLMGLQETVMRILPKRQFESVPSLVRQRYPGLVEPAITEAQEIGKKGFLQVVQEMAKIDFRPLLPLIAVPSLILCGSQDRVNLPAARQLGREIPAAQLYIAPKAGHVWNLEYPDAFAQVVGRFWHTHTASN